ncbi:uncharacterized protein UV8b_05077 [Ustilaginoidea virens]|uniref:Carrier domain-containing protein n=1 Tax=Ustilaginoidea virens TaxID=1159556 RepID=A0A063BPE4_USTVR|nr:uncharacterized protein UV8b_05077 [Ustilaginoidea virens]QUC20836.1 hypothetical protein UV8b_05077 [Ustilaginoidea virens]GAO14909.1 hypothetical protein UVI_02007470 [Ustilaginoidea virens]
MTVKHFIEDECDDRAGVVKRVRKLPATWQADSTEEYNSLNDETVILRRQDLDQIWAWNRELPPLIQRCMHDIVHEVSERQPDAVAVCSWDGSLTYREIDNLSSQFASELVRQGVAVGTRIPLCFEKSMWAVVSLLGVMKAGATFSLTDPSQPEARLRTIVEQTGADFVITSVAQEAIGLKISKAGKLIAISPEYFEQVSQKPSENLPLVPASSPMYIIFTSGSTGKPKGVMISHENYTSGAIPRAEAVGYKPHSRCFDFPSYAFDVSIDCMLCTLANGGTICVPSEADRMNDLSGAIRKSSANMVHMTPSVARTLDPDIIPSLDVLGLGGEAVSAKDAAAWSQQTNLIIAYGPSECTVGCTINNTLHISTGIGKGVGGVTWITHPEDHHVLMGIGEVGELLIEGPVVGIGYVDEPEKTAEVFIEDPTWLKSGHGQTCGRRGRLYKTGDLVRYESNNLGGIEFVGRKDQQVKIRGQRVELTEVEHHLQRFLPAGVKVAAEVVKPGGAGAPTLVAFLSEPCGQDFKEAVELYFVEQPSAQLNSALSTIDKNMGDKVPRYMIPAAFVPLNAMPSLISGKTDRKRLREIAASLSRHDLFGMQNPATPESEQLPQTEMEKLLSEAWRKVTGCEATLFRHTNFFGVGGDSLRAMRLVAVLREAFGISITVADIFMNPTLANMASKSRRICSTSASNSIPPFSLLEKDWAETNARIETASLCSIEPDTVEDVYPCTPLQEALMALSAKVKEAYVAQRVVELADVESAHRLMTAFDMAQKGCPILRTRIVQVPGRGLVQVVVKGRLEFFEGTDLEGYLSSDRDASMDLGKPLVRYALISDRKAGKTNFVLTMHHALYDGWCMPLIVDRVNKAYNRQPVARSAEFKHFIQYIREIDKEASAKYWRNQLQGASRLQFPSHPFPGYQAKADSLLEEYVALPRLPESHSTIATVIRAAWAYVASRYTNSEDVVFGETLTGRNAPIVGAEEIEGPMITTVPFRVQVNGEMSIPEYLGVIQKQVAAQIPHEHFGLQHIRRLSPDALEACELKTGLVLHPSSEGHNVSEENLPASCLVPAGDKEAAQEALKFNTYPLMLVCSIDPKGFLVMASFDSRTISPPWMQRVLGQFRQVAEQLCDKSFSCVGDLSCLTPLDLTQLGELPNSTREDVMPGLDGVESFYIVDSKDTNKLVPIGAIGALIVRSRSVLQLPRITTPSWVRQLVDPDSEDAMGNLYQTGVLAKYSVEGHIRLLDAVTQQNGEGRIAAPSTAKRVSATSRRQRRLRKLWSRVLLVKEEEIGLNDNFFLLGGDSIAAMKLVSEARADGIKLTVMQMFEKRTLYDMASVVEEDSVSNNGKVEQIPEFSLLGQEDPSSFVNTVVRPQLVDPQTKILNVLPTRPLQQIAVKGTTQFPRYSARYELMYFDDSIDEEHVRYACQELVSRNEILRTVFVEHENQGYGVVLERLEAEFVTYTSESGNIDNLEEYARDLCRSDALSDMPLGSSFVKWFLVKHGEGRACLILRISHAQYDEICLPILLKQLSALYENRPVQESVPFSWYVGHVLQHNIPSSIGYWKRLLSGSSMTILKPELAVEKTNHFAVQRAVDIATRSRDVTVATLPTAAWALCLARRLSLRDVTFGEVVSGRNIDFPNADAVTGPCWQYVPVRVEFDASWTVADLLAYVQHQHVASSAHEGMGLYEIMDQCTDWSEKARPGWFDSVVHQDVAHVETLPFARARCRMETLYPHEEPLREWKVQAFIDGDSMTLEIVTLESWAEYARGLLADLAQVVELLVSRPRATLF